MIADRRVLLLATLVALAPACGHRGDPLPPRRRTPPAPHDFRLAQRGDALEARATAPLASVDGVTYETLTVEFLYAEGLKDLEKAGRRHAVPAVPGSRVVEALPLPAPGTILRVAARGVAGGEKGPRTLTLSLVAQAPLGAPSELSAALAEDGVALSWHGVRPKAIAARPRRRPGCRQSRAAPCPPGPRPTAPPPPAVPPAPRPAPAPRPHPHSRPPPAPGR